MRKIRQLNEEKVKYDDLPAYILGYSKDGDGMSTYRIVYGSRRLDVVWYEAIHMMGTPIFDLDGNKLSTVSEVEKRMNSSPTGFIGLYSQTNQQSSTLKSKKPTTFRDNGLMFIMNPYLRMRNSKFFLDSDYATYEQRNAYK